MIEKREHVRATLTVEAAGHQFAMTRMSAADWIALRRGDLDDGGLVASALGAIVDSSLPDGSELDLAEGLALMRAWVKAHKDDAVPPA
jgi:hypothetical protein